MVVPFYNRTASTWTLVTLKTTWTSHDYKNSKACCIVFTEKTQVDLSDMSALKTRRQGAEDRL